MQTTICQTATAEDSHFSHFMAATPIRRLGQINLVGLMQQPIYISSSYRQSATAANYIVILLSEVIQN